jgi:L-lactate dehydrogenase complex protein LldF
VHVALLGIEKLVPRLRDLPVFLKLLARSSTGQPLTVYTTLINGPKRADDLDGPEELHVVLLDNGRSALLTGEFAEVLRCIRCGACLNACPVYRNLGGHAYGSVYPGPIGSLVTPLLRGLDEHAELSRASSLCGACQVVCPVKVDIPGLLVRLRARTRRTQPLLKRVAMRVWKWMMKSPTRYRWAQWWLPHVLSDRGDGWSRGGPGPLGAWTHSRDLPIPPKQSFRRLWRERLSDER